MSFGVERQTPIAHPAHQATDGDVRLEGLLDENGTLEGEHYVHIRHVDDGEWTLELVEEIE